MQAAILRTRLRWLLALTDRRREIARSYRERIRSGAVEMLAAPQEEQAHVYHLFVVRCARRDALQAHLRARGVESLIHYPVPVHLQPPCREVRRDPAGLGESERHAATCLSLPCHPAMTDAEVGQVIDAVNAFEAAG